MTVNLIFVKLLKNEIKTVDVRPAHKLSVIITKLKNNKFGS